MKIVIHPDFMQTADFIKQLPQHFAQEGELLYEGRNEVRRYRVKNEWLVVKNISNLISFNGLFTLFQEKQNGTGLPFAGMLRKRGFDTPHEVAYIEKKRGGLFLDGYFISTQCDFPPCPKCCGNAGSTNMPQTSWLRSWCNCTKKEYYMAT